MELVLASTLGSLLALHPVPSGTYDAADRVLGGHQTCICGFCVDASAPVRGVRIGGTDLHWTRGPWVRLDGILDLTADHRVLAPSGPVPAGRLRSGDLVLSAGGPPRRLRTVRVLPLGPERRGINLRTASGTFTSRGFVLESEQGRPCSPSHRAAHVTQRESSRR